jgi:splicing factor 3B subunit 3
MYMRMENQPLSGRDHMAYRSYHGAVKNVVDGDLCEQFIRMDREKQNLLAEEVDRKPVEVMKKLEDIRNRIL